MYMYLVDSDPDSLDRLTDWLTGQLTDLLSDKKTVADRQTVPWETYYRQADRQTVPWDTYYRQADGQIIQLLLLGPILVNIND